MDRRRMDDDRGSRDRGSDRERSRDRDDDRGSRDRGRERDDDRGSRSRDRDDDRGSSRSGGGSYRYQARSAEDVQRRADADSKFDKLLKPGIKNWKPNDGDNRIRVVPPTWKDAQHFGLDVHVHYGVGADRQSYLCLHKMKNEADPIHEEYERFARECDPEDKKDAEYLRELKGTGRVLIYLIDRDNEKEGVQAWFMPSSLDRDIVKISVDKDSGEVLPIDHPEDGYDVLFERNGKGMNTKYEGVNIARRSTPLGKREWLEFAVENPLPDQLQYFDYDHIAKAFGGKVGGGNKDRERERDDDRERDFSGRRDRGDSDRGGRDSGRERDRGGSSRDEKVEMSWESIHDMTKSELKDLIESEKIDIDAGDAKDTEDLADWICDELKLKKAERKRERDDDDKPRSRERDEDVGERMRGMRDRLRD